ncbi:MAG: hypothetical protein L0Y50_02425 [Beijerinckiaceae bacterium]|nr:hypothetical protein [Beijerinckiaceae bacterium]MCI0735122.1 hypothetical protein [Beijerinckiaceae bacterium]
MKYHEDPNFRVIATLMACGVLSSLVVLFSIYLYFQRRQGDPFFASDEYRIFQEHLTVQNIRRQIAEEFVDAVVSCISPPIAAGDILTEQEVTERVAAAIGNYSGENAKLRKCGNTRSTHWTFEAPCKLNITKSFAQSSGGLNLGNIEICATILASTIRYSIGHCTASSNFPECMLSSILANDNVKREIEKPVEAQAARSK